MKEEIKSHWRSWVFYLTLGTILIILYKALDSIAYLGIILKQFISIIAPFLVGLLLAYLAYIPEEKIERILKKSKIKFFKKNKRKLGILTTYILFAILILIIVNFIMPVLTESINELINNIQNYYTKIIEIYNELPDDSLFKTEQIYSALKEIQNVDLKQYVSMDRITEYLKSAVGIARSLFDVFVAIIVSIYILSERDEMLQFAKKFVKAFFKEKTGKYLERYFYSSNGIFFKFITSQFLDAVVVGILAVIVMNLMKIKYASLLGFVIGLFNMIPYFGAIIAVIIAGLITFITAGISKALFMLIVIIILQQIDANIINPKIIGDSLKISPIIVIVSVTIGGAYFGVIGMFLAVPVAAILKILVNDYIDNKI